MAPASCGALVTDCVAREPPLRRHCPVTRRWRCAWMNLACARASHTFNRSSWCTCQRLDAPHVDLWPRARAISCPSCRAEGHVCELLALLRARGRMRDGPSESGSLAGWVRRAAPRCAPSESAMGMMTVRIFPYVTCVSSNLLLRVSEVAIGSTHASAGDLVCARVPPLPLQCTLAHSARAGKRRSNGGWLFATGERGDAAARAGA